MKLAQTIKEKRQHDRQLQRQLLRAKEEEASKKQQEADVVVSKDQNLMSAIFPSASSSDRAQEAVKQIKTSESDESDLESLEGNEGIFSDDEDPQALQNRASVQYDPYMTQRPGVAYPHALGAYFEGYGGQIMGLQLPKVRYQYNPFEFLEQRFNRFA